MAAVVRNAHVLHCERGKCYNDRSIGVVGNSVARLIYIPLFVWLGYGCRVNLCFCCWYCVICYKLVCWGGVGWGVCMFCCSGSVARAI